MALAKREIVTQSPARLYTEAEYLAQEETAEEKSEYVDGQIRSRPGGTADHGALSVSVGASLHNALRGRDYLVMSCDMKVLAAGQIYYPDVTVTSGPRQYYTVNRHVIMNPLLVVEVLSPDTEYIDRGEKHQNYLAIESLMAYLLVSQNEPRVEQFSRSEDGDWQYTVAERLESVLLIPSLSLELKLADIYDQVDFADEASDE